MEQKKNITPFRQEVLSKSNFFIGAKYKASILEHQIIYLAMFKIQEREYEERPDGIYVKMSAAEIKKTTGSAGGSFYHRLKAVSEDMTGNPFGVADDTKEHFIFITPINYAEYENGEFKIRFALEFKKYLVNVQTDFTPIAKEIAMNLRKKAYSFPLYQILKKQCYYPKGYTGEKNYVFSVTIGLSELKLEMGLVNLKDSPDVKKALYQGKGTEEDYTKAIKKSKDKMFEAFSDFNNKCLKPSIDEINEKTDIYVEYHKNRKGRGGRVYAIEFIIYLKGKDENKNIIPASIDKEGRVTPKISQEQIFMFCMEACNLLNEYHVGLPEMMSIAEAANYDIEKIKRAKSLLEKTPGEIQNVTGWLISCIKKGYEEPVQRKANGRQMKPVKNKFHNFEEREYSDEQISDLEKALLKQEIVDIDVPF